jgi:hypothetical protein
MDRQSAVSSMVARQGWSFPNPTSSAILTAETI